MAQPITLTDTDFMATLQAGKPTLLLLNDGSGLRGDFSTAFNKAVEENDDIVFARINIRDNPMAAEHFGYGNKPLLVALFEGEELVRRTRPWGTDVPLTIELLRNTAGEQDQPSELEQETVEETSRMSNEPTVDTKPVHVTDATFEEEVLNQPLPVLIDFWAEWCGPCRMVAPILDKLAEEYAGKIRIAKVDVDQNQGLAQHFRIMSIPTLMMVKDRTIVFSQPGALPEPSLRDLIEQLIALEIPKEDEVEASEEEAEETINEA